MKNFINKKLLGWILILLLASSCRNKKNDSTSQALSLSSTSAENWETECLISSIDDLDLFYTKEQVQLEGSSLTHKETYYESSQCEKKIRSQTSTWSYEILSEENDGKRKIKLGDERKTLTFYNPLALSAYQTKNPEEKGELGEAIQLTSSNLCKTLYTTLEFDSESKSLKFYSLRGSKNEAFPPGFLPYKVFYQ